MEIVRQALAVNRSGTPEATVEAAVALAHPQCEFSSRLSSVEGATYRGHDGVRRYFADLADAFREWSNDMDVIEDLDSDGILTDGTFRGTSRSGVALERRSVMVWTCVDGKVASLHAYESREEASAAIGLSE